MIELTNAFIALNNFRITTAEKWTSSGRVQLVLDFVTTAPATQPVTYFADELGIHQTDAGRLGGEINDRETIIISLRYAISFVDLIGNLSRILDHPNLLYSSCRCTLWIDGAARFLGYLAEETIEINAKEKSVRVEFFPRTNLLNDTPLYVDIPNVGYRWNNALGSGYRLDGSKYPVGDLIKAIMRIVEPAATFQFENHWIYKGWYSSGGTQYFDRTFESVWVQLNELIAEDGSEATDETYMDVLSRLCYTFGALAGFTSQTEAIFKPFREMGQTVYEITDKLLDYTIRVTKPKLKWVTYQGYGETTMVIGTLTSISQEGMDTREFIPLYLVRPAGYGGSLPFSQVISIRSYSGAPSGSGWATFIPQYWADYYLSRNSMYRDRISVNGIHYQFGVKMKVRGVVYLPVRIEINLDSGTTEIEGVRMG